jgi:hypothetical protein
MNIRGTIYEALSPRQRIIATMDAIARDDTAEIDRLKTTCPYRVYRQRDAAFIDALEALFGAGLAVEGDLRGAALSWWAHPVSGRDEQLLQDMAAIEAAWQALLADMGITSLTAAAPPRHPLVARLLEIAPEPNSQRVEENFALLKAAVPA